MGALCSTVCLLVSTSMVVLQQWWRNLCLRLACDFYMGPMDSYSAVQFHQNVVNNYWVNFSHHYVLIATPLIYKARMSVAGASPSLIPTLTLEKPVNQKSSKFLVAMP